MQTNNDNLARQREKRQRVNRMKKTIVIFLLCFIVLTLISLVFLVISVLSLSAKVKELETSTVTIEETKAVATDDGDLDSEKLYTVDNLDNLAEEGDIPRVYLTFDDGPSDNTDAILDILDDYNIKATFFVVGKDVDTYGDAYKRIVDDGHTIGMHSYSHNYSAIYSSKEAFESDFNEIHDLIYDVTGVDSKFYRFPGGSSNKLSNIGMYPFISFLNEEGVEYFDWNVSSGDATSAAFTSAELVDNVMTDVVKYKTSVVLLHDSRGKQATVEALPELIEALQQEGAMILPITDDTTVIQHISVVQ